jgi:predicted metal-dependent phosphoesterase TrpH
VAATLVVTSQRIGALLFVGAVLAGTLLGAATSPTTADGLILAADLHVHPFPGDGALVVPQLQREARRRGLDVIALTGHNNQAGWRMGQLLGATARDVIVLPGQEVTAPDFHIAAVGIGNPVDWRLPVRDVIAAIHAQGGAAIAAHPLKASWLQPDEGTLALLDGAEVAHPVRDDGEKEQGELDQFFAAARAVNADLSPVGSSDFHMAAPLGRCRTYLFVDERTADGVVRALRTGRTVAECGDAELFGTPELAARVPAYIRARRHSSTPSTAEQASAAAALAGLALMCTRRRPE